MLVKLRFSIRGPAESVSVTLREGAYARALGRFAGRAAGHCWGRWGEGVAAREVPTAASPGGRGGRGRWRYRYPYNVPAKGQPIFSSSRKKFLKNYFSLGDDASPIPSSPPWVCAAHSPWDTEGPACVHVAAQSPRGRHPSGQREHYLKLAMEC